MSEFNTSGFFSLQFQDNLEIQSWLSCTDVIHGFHRRVFHCFREFVRGR